jgi:hypothetical protein
MAKPTTLARTDVHPAPELLLSKLAVQILGSTSNDLGGQHPMLVEHYCGLLSLIEK